MRRNLVYLLLNSGILALFGFVVWNITAHIIYSPNEIGVKIALIGVVAFVGAKIAIGLFRTYEAWYSSTYIYSLVFWGLSYRWLLKDEK